MVNVWIDNQCVEASPGETILDAAGKLGIEVPTLCYLKGCEPCTSCFVCVVKVDGRENMVPSCATVVREGMRVQSETPEVREARKAALELLLSDHLGDCRGPCHVGCPANMNIPRMIRQIAAGDLAGAIATVKADIPLPATLGRICPAPCEKVCRRKLHDAPVSVCLLKRYVGDWDLLASQPYLPPMSPATGKRVAIVGAGPAGLAAAYYLLRDGQAVTVYDEHERPGGAVRYGMMAQPGGEDRLPPSVLDAEIAVIERMGAKFELGRKVFRDIPIENLRGQFDAILLATGAMDLAGAELLGEQEHAVSGAMLPSSEACSQLARIFAAGGAAGRSGRMAVRALADGKAAAGAITRYLAGKTAEPKKIFNCRMGKLLPGELEKFLAQASVSPRIEPVEPSTGFVGCAGSSRSEGSAHGEKAGFAESEAIAESRRCLHCDCRGAGDEHAESYPCKLRYWAQVYGGHATQGQALGAPKQDARATPRRVFERQDHPRIVYESGKCIACGLCVQIAAREGEKLGLAFIGRGFDVRVGVPFDKPLVEALTHSALACAAACPTVALAVK